MTITLATLPEATSQEVFDQVASHLLTQKRKSLGDHGCVYRSYSGLKCAAGCLISDHEYQSSFEGRGWKYLHNQGRVPKTHAELIEELQKVHDEADDTKSWKEDLRRVAEKYKLKTNVLKNFT